MFVDERLSQPLWRAETPSWISLTGSKDLVRPCAKPTPPKVHTEEATKTALVLPVLSAAGYDIFDPDEVVPEYTADVGKKQGEKVDYAILKDGAPIIILECTSAGSDLNSANASRFSVTSRPRNPGSGSKQTAWSMESILGLDEPNKMDFGPFAAGSTFPTSRPTLFARQLTTVRQSFRWTCEDSYPGRHRSEVHHGHQAPPRRLSENSKNHSF